MKEITPETKYKTFLFDVPPPSWKLLRDFKLTIDVFNRCLMFAKDKEERRYWAESVLVIEKARMNFFLDLVSSFLGCPKDEINKYLAIAPVMEEIGGKIFLTFYDETLEQLQLQSIVH